MSELDVKMAAKMKVLRQKYLEQLEPRIKEVKHFINECHENNLSEYFKQEVSNTAHKLSGSGATYGFGAISDAARMLEEAMLTEPLPDVHLLSGRAQILLDACMNARSSVASQGVSKERMTGENLVGGPDVPVILCVDDDESMRLILPQVFREKAEVLLAQDGNQALEILKERTPNVILLDHNMPNLSGVDLLKILEEKDLKKKIAIVMLSSSKTNASVLQAFKHGIIDYIVKPFEPAALYTRIAGLLDRLKQKILIADDDEAIRDLLGSRFEAMGYTVCFAEDASTAYSTACDEMPHIIILDRMLPGGDGLSVFRRLLAEPKTKNIPILFLTAKKRENDIIEALKQGAQDYVVKPFKVDEVVLRCERLMNAPVARR